MLNSYDICNAEGCVSHGNSDHSLMLGQNVITI